MTTAQNRYGSRGPLAVHQAPEIAAEFQSGSAAANDKQPRRFAVQARFKHLSDLDQIFDRLNGKNVLTPDGIAIGRHIAASVE